MGLIHTAPKITYACISNELKSERESEAQVVHKEPPKKPSSLNRLIPIILMWELPSSTAGPLLQHKKLTPVSHTVQFQSRGVGSGQKLKLSFHDGNQPRLGCGAMELFLVGFLKGPRSDRENLGQVFCNYLSRLNNN